MGGRGRTDAERTIDATNVGDSAMLVVAMNEIWCINKSLLIAGGAQGHGTELRREESPDQHGRGSAAISQRADPSSATR